MALEGGGLMIVFTITMFFVCCAVVVWLLLKESPPDPASRSSSIGTKDTSLGGSNDSSWQQPDPNWLRPADPPARSALQFKIATGVMGKPGWLAKLFAAAIGTINIPTKIVFNGQEFNSPDEMPEAVRGAYEQAMSGVLTDANRNGIPDLFEGGAGQGVFQVEAAKNFALEDPAEKLRKLKELKDAGLIDDAEYETKKTEILARL
jgi:hypothetical protein